MSLVSLIFICGTLIAGFVSGSSYTDSGAAVDHLCLTNDPQGEFMIRKSIATHSSAGFCFTFMILEYRIRRFDFDKYDHHQVACSVCMKRRRVSTVMIPVRKDCYGDWVKEYDGYLYAGHPTHAAASE